MIEELNEMYKDYLALKQVVEDAEEQLEKYPKKNSDYFPNGIKMILSDADAAKYLDWCELRKEREIELRGKISNAKIAFVDQELKIIRVVPFELHNIPLFIAHTAVPDIDLWLQIINENKFANVSFYFGNSIGKIIGEGGSNEEVRRGCTNSSDISHERAVA